MCVKSRNVHKFRSASRVLPNYELQHKLGSMEQACYKFTSEDKCNTIIARKRRKPSNISPTLGKLYVCATSLCPRAILWRRLPEYISAHNLRIF